MRVDLNGLLPDPLIRHNQSGPSTNSTSSSEVKDDGDTLSTDASSIEALTSQALATPELRHDRVAELRQAISSGQYQVEPDKVADAILADASARK